VRLAEALDDRASFRCFCGLAAHEPTPERTAFVRFRRKLVGRHPDRALFEEVTRRFKAGAVTVKTGTLLDATLIASASHTDSGAAWAGHQRRRAAESRPGRPALDRPGPAPSSGPVRKARAALS
jgi:IS5 family transposase